MARKVSMDELNRMSADEFKNSEKSNFVFVLNNIRSLNNVGSIFRTADAFRAEKIYLCGLTGTPPHRDITKTALGAEETVMWQYEKDIVALLHTLKQKQYKIIAVEQAKESLMLQYFIPNSVQKYAFVLGNEVFGVDDEVVAISDMCVEIPQFGTKHSLNVAVSAGIIAWNFVEKHLKNLT